MAYHIKSRKVNRKLMYRIIKRQQEVINILTTLIVRAGIVLTKEDLEHPEKYEKKLIKGLDENLGLPPFPSRVQVIDDPNVVHAVNIAR